MAIETGILFGLLVMILWGSSKVIAKKAMGIIGPYYALFYERIIIALVIIVGVLPFISFKIPSTSTLLIILVASIIGALGIFFLFKAMDKGKVSIVSPIAQSSVIFTVILSYLVYKENIAPLKWVAVFLLIAGTLLISFRYSSLKNLDISGSLPGVKYAVLVMVLWGAFYFVIKPVVLALGPLLAAVYIELIISMMIVLASAFTGIKMPGKALKYTVLSGIAVAAAAISFNAAIEKTALSIIYPLANSSLLVTVLLSHMILGERIELNQKIAIFLILAGIILVSI